MEEVIETNYEIIDARGKIITKLLTELENVKRPKGKSKAKR